MPTTSEAMPAESFRPHQRILAWLVHIFTASGGIAGLLAIDAIFNARWFECFLYLTIATFIDAVDGTLARWFRVKTVLPRFDGALLDNITDYFTYVLIPALIVAEAALVPRGTALPAAAVIVLASAYQFCQSDAKTDDHYFRGWPSYWNILVFYLVPLQLPPWLNFAIILLCGALIFIPIKYIYPSRTVRFRRLTLALTCIWAIIFVAMLFQYPDPHPWLMYASLVYFVYYYGLSLVLHALNQHVAPA
ncbi:MAG: CDP-diacylglycerol O-phosphatidyltransferase [Candidatus Hydrogenedentes bacterium]|nr:CDP-diacylglycerol O-phosphatidyltransferase [Candidatus Hydrogenedentota bacterium]